MESKVGSSEKIMMKKIFTLLKLFELCMCVCADVCRDENVPLEMVSLILKWIFPFSSIFWRGKKSKRHTDLGVLVPVLGVEQISLTFCGAHKRKWNCTCQQNAHFLSLLLYGRGDFFLFSLAQIEIDTLSIFLIHTNTRTRTTHFEMWYAIPCMNFLFWHFFVTHSLMNAQRTYRTQHTLTNEFPRKNLHHCFHVFSSDDN